jgi:RHS repeat-associated protein
MIIPAARPNAGTYFYYGVYPHEGGERLGSVAAMVDTSRAIVEQYKGACPGPRSGDSFGGTKVYDGSGSEKTSIASFLGNPLLKLHASYCLDARLCSLANLPAPLANIPWVCETLTARRYDYENAANLYYYRSRMYSPALGRFLQTDPIGYADSMNLYAYCGNNPLNWIDPYGLKMGWLELIGHAFKGSYEGHWGEMGKGALEGANEGQMAANEQVVSGFYFVWNLGRWATGITPASGEYGPGTSFCDDMRDAKSVQKARAKMKKNLEEGKGKPIKEHGEQAVLFFDETDMMEQFVGKYSIEVIPHVDRGTLEFILRNNSTVDSALSDNIPFPSYRYGPGHDWEQVIRWEEPIQ